MTIGAPPPGMDEYQRLMAERAAAKKRNRMITIAVIVVVGVAGGAWWRSQTQKKAKAQEQVEAGGRFAELDKNEMGSFWNCVFTGEVDIGMFKGLDQVQQRLESAYFTQQKTFSEHLTNECLPKLERARSAYSSFPGSVPANLKDPAEKYAAVLPKLQGGLETYAERIKGRAAVKDVDALIQEMGAAWTPDVTPEGVAFEKFLNCAIPDLQSKKDIQEVLELLAKTCKEDPIKFMTHVREDCGALVTNVDKEAKPEPSKTYKATAKKFYEDEQRQLQAWEWCAKRSRKGKKVLDAEEFLNAVGDYMEARHGVPQAAREAVATILGEPTKKNEGHGKPGAPGAAPEGAPGPAPAAPAKE